MTCDDSVCVCVGGGGGVHSGQLSQHITDLSVSRYTVKPSIPYTDRTMYN